MRMRVLLEAEWEVRDAARWYEELRQGLGETFLDEYGEALESIRENPKSFPHMETVNAPRETRRCLLRQFPYFVVYQVLENELIILAVAHGRRRPNYWINRSE